mmetsp:Transcript_9386/g.16633  ORF Transcript_9386/g.16633 Transcript_9386/m.16633 type:complete len:266 (+) Transcript_9386:68-865(+)
MGAKPSADATQSSSPSSAARSISRQGREGPAEVVTDSNDARWAWNDISAREVIMQQGGRDSSGFSRRRRRRSGNAAAESSARNLQASAPRFSPATSSTATPPTESRPPSSSVGTWLPADETCSEVASEYSQPDESIAKRAEVQLSQARQKSNESMEALRLNLRGLGSAVAVRYTSWPVGCSVEVSIPPDPEETTSRWSYLPARLINYDQPSNSIQVRLRDSSMRIVPAFRVRRVAAARGPRGGQAELDGEELARRSRTRSPDMLH